MPSKRNACAWRKSARQSFARARGTQGPHARPREASRVAAGRARYGFQGAGAGQPIRVSLSTKSSIQIERSWSSGWYDSQPTWTVSNTGASQT